MLKRYLLPIFIILALGLGITVLIIFLYRDPPPEPFSCNNRPCNIVLIIPDALSARHMGIYGYERDTTPFIDEFFSEEGIIFENAWSAAPWTLPSFAALFTSQLPSEIFVEERRDRLSDKIPTFIDVLAENKVAKFAAHSGTVLSGPNLDQNVITRFKPEERFLAEDPFLFIKAIEWIKEQNNNNRSQPFFLLLHLLAPHSPYDPPQPYRFFFDAPLEYPGSVTDEELLEARAKLWLGEDVKTEKIYRFRLQYDQEIRYLDSMLESFISRIPKEVLQNTVFIFTSDHGEAFGQHGDLLHGAVPYEEVIHVPFLVKVPGATSKKIEEPITLIDVGPTILEIYSLKSPKTFKGISLVSAIRGEYLPILDRIIRAERFFLEFPFLDEEIGTKVRKKPYSGFSYIALRRANFKLIQGRGDSLELYNLERDYYEQNNLIPQWRLLSKEEQIEAIPLFEVLGKSLPEE